MMLLAAMAAMVVAAASPALAQDNDASVDSTQVLQQVGGDQYATATGGTGEGDVAAANSQEFNATQVQQSAAIAGEGNAAALNVGSGEAKAAAHPTYSEHDSDDNVAVVESTQVLQQVGGDQTAVAVGGGDGDVAAANSQEFEATQVQQSLAVAGEGNAAAVNAEIEDSGSEDDSAPVIDQSETVEEDGGSGVIVVVEAGDTLSGIASLLGTTVEELAADNGIEDPDLIFPGQILVS